MKEFYLIEDLQKKLKKSRTQALRFAQQQGWTVSKEKIGKVYKNVYSKTEIDSYCSSLVKKEEEKKTITRTVAKREAKQIDELPNWNQRVANSRFILCRKLEEAYEESLGNKEEIIKKFVLEAKVNFPHQMTILKKISVPTLRRWWGIYLKNRNNPLALASGHGGQKGLRRVDKDVLEAAKSLYFSKNKPQMSVVWSELVKIFGIGCISYQTLRNFLNKDVNIIEKNKARMGPKEFKDTHTPYIVRSYEDIKAGDIWTADGHDIDALCRVKVAGKWVEKKLKLIMWLDIKSRLVVGWTLSKTETTEAIAIALKRGIEKYGLPKQIYTDNGKAFTSKVLEGTEELDGIYASLGVEVTHALPYNAQAKNIERWFTDFKQNLSKRFNTYIGGNVLERPEHMKGLCMTKIARGEAVTENELEIEIEKYIEEKNHLFYAIRRAGGRKAHRGKGMNNRTPLEVFNEEYPLEQRRRIEDEKLRLLFMYTETRQVRQNGIEFMENLYTSEHLYYHFSEKVVIKYDPHNLSYIYVYLESGEFLCKADKLNPTGFNDVNAIKTHKNRLKKIAKLGAEIIGIREEIRNDTNIIEYVDKPVEIKKAIVNKKGKESIKLADGVYVEID